MGKEVKTESVTANKEPHVDNTAKPAPQPAGNAAPIHRRAPGTKEVIPFLWKICGYGDGYTLTLFKCTDRADADAQLARLEQQDHYQGLAIYELDAVVPPPPNTKKHKNRAAHADVWKQTNSRVKKNTAAAREKTPVAQKPTPTPSTKDSTESTRTSAVKKATTKPAKGTKKTRTKSKKSSTDKTTAKRKTAKTAKTATMAKAKTKANAKPATKKKAGKTAKKG